MISFLKNIFVLLFSLFFALLLGEIALRLWGKDIVPLSLPDKDVGQIERKNITTRRFIPESEKEITIRTNSFGYRDDEWDLESPDKKIMVVGDSFVDAMQVEEDFRFTELLEKDLRGIDIPTTVFNFGKSGSGPESYLLVIKKWLPLVRPDMVIVSIFNGNDFENINYDITPASGRVNYVVKEEKVLPYTQLATKKERVTWEIKHYLGKSYLVQITNDARIKWKHRNAEPTSGIPLFCDKENPHQKNSYLIMEHLVRELHSLLGDKLILLIIPEKNQELLSFPSCDTKLSETFFKNLGEELEIPVIPLIDSLKPKTSIFYYPGHLNEKGHEKVRDVLLRELLSPLP